MNTATQATPEFYQHTGATSHAVNDLVLFTENDAETAAERDRIFKLIETQPDIFEVFIAGYFRPLLVRALQNYAAKHGRENSKHLQDLTNGQKSEFYQIYKKEYLNREK